MRRLLPFCAGLGLLTLPWLLRNWVWLGNPAAPFLNDWFPNPYWTGGMEREYLAGLAQYPQFKSYWELSLQLTVLGGLVPGFLGPVWLLTPVAFLALRQAEGRLLLLAGFVCAVPAWMNTEVRFLIPAIPFVSLALGLAMSNSRGVLPALAVFHAVTSWPSVMDVYSRPDRVGVCAEFRCRPLCAWNPKRSSLGGTSPITA